MDLETAPRFRDHPQGALSRPVERRAEGDSRGLAAAGAAHRRRAPAAASAGDRPPPRSYVSDYSVPLVNAARRGDPSASSVAVTVAGKRRGRDSRRFDSFVATERARRDASGERRRRRADGRSSPRARARRLDRLILLFLGYLTRAIVWPVRRASAMAGRLAGGDLSVRMPETEWPRSARSSAPSTPWRLAGGEPRRPDQVARAGGRRQRRDPPPHRARPARRHAAAAGLAGARAARGGGDGATGADRASVAAVEHGGGPGGAVEELQEISRGIHPAILSKGGLGPR